MSRVKTIIALIFAVCVALFAVQNYEQVVIRFLFYNFRISQALVIVLSTALGVVIGLVAGLNSAMRANKSKKELTKTHSQAQQQIVSKQEENEKLKAEIEALQQKIRTLETPIPTSSDSNSPS